MPNRHSQFSRPNALQNVIAVFSFVDSILMCMKQYSPCHASHGGFTRGITSYDPSTLIDRLFSRGVQKKHGTRVSVQSEAMFGKPSNGRALLTGHIGLANTNRGRK